MDRRRFLQNGAMAALSTLMLPRWGATEEEECALTTPDGRGPFYQAGVPFRTQMVLPGEPGERLRVSGTVSDCAGHALPDAVVDVWQANAAGCYSINEQCGVIPDHPDKFHVRARVRTDARGRYRFETVKPGQYGWRPSHIHYRVVLPDANGQARTELITQLYFEGDPRIERDWLASRSRTRSRILPLIENPATGGKECTFHIVVPAVEESASALPPPASPQDYDLLIQRFDARAVFTLPDSVEFPAGLTFYHLGGRRLGEESFRRNRIELNTERIGSRLCLARLQVPSLGHEESFHFQF
jgi:catechol 1,2-dioxygenase